MLAFLAGQRFWHQAIFNQIKQIFSLLLVGGDTILGERRKNTFGTEMVIIAERSSSDIDVEFLDEHHYVKRHTTYTNFKVGKIKNPYDKSVFGIGYLGDGKYGTGLKGILDEPYYEWKNLLARCFNESTKDKFKSYYRISFCTPEWCNFQNFAKWFEENRYDVNERLHIDKDIMYPGNKIYSPYHCLLVPQRINMLFTNKSNKRGLPNGIYKDKNGFLAKYRSHVLGTSATIEGAFQLYAKAKKDKIVEIANEYRSIIPQNVYNALINYEVRIENDKNYIRN